MRPDRRILLALAFVGAFLTVGMPYWQIPYGKVSLPDAVWTFGLLVVAGFAGWPRRVSDAGLWRATPLAARRDRP